MPLDTEKEISNVYEIIRHMQADVKVMQSQVKDFKDDFAKHDNNEMIKYERIWKAIDGLRKLMDMALGIALVINVVGVPLLIFFLTK